MVTINAALLQAQFNDAAISATNSEIVLDGAINLLNTFGADIDNLTGVAGSKTGTYTSAQTGAIMTMAQKIYSKHWKNAANSSTNLGSMGVTYGADTELLTYAGKLAKALKTATTTGNIPIFVSNDPVPT